MGREIAELILERARVGVRVPLPKGAQVRSLSNAFWCFESEGDTDATTSLALTIPPPFCNRQSPYRPLFVRALANATEGSEAHQRLRLLLAFGDFQDAGDADRFAEEARAVVDEARRRAERQTEADTLRWMIRTFDFAMDHVSVLEGAEELRTLGDGVSDPLLSASASSSGYVAAAESGRTDSAARWHALQISLAQRYGAADRRGDHCPQGNPRSTQAKSRRHERSGLDRKLYRRPCSGARSVRGGAVPVVRWNWISPRRGDLLGTDRADGSRRHFQVQLARLDRGCCRSTVSSGTTASSRHVGSRRQRPAGGAQQTRGRGGRILRDHRGSAGLRAPQLLGARGRRPRRAATTPKRTTRAAWPCWRMRTGKHPPSAWIRCAGRWSSSGETPIDRSLCPTASPAAKPRYSGWPPAV